MENRPTFDKIRQPELFSVFQKIDIQQSIVSRFEQQVRLRPNSLAVEFRGHTVTYDDLNKSANRLARALLLVKQVHPRPIALLIEQSISLVTCILAVLKAGFIYAPLDRRQPDRLLEKTFNNLNPSFVLTDCHNQHIAHAVARDFCPVINIDEVEYGSSSDDLEQSIDPDSIANIYYTSGSTGSPKGVTNSHRNALHNVMRYTNTLCFSTEDRMSLIQHSSFSGVVSTLFGALLNGATLCLFDLEKDGLTALSKWVQDERISIFHSVPSIFRQFTKSCSYYQHLRIIRLEGDLATARDINFYKENIVKTCILVNGLGATECGLVRQYAVGHDTNISENDIPVGYQVEDMDVHVIDEFGNDARTGHSGEIVIRSQFLAQGYWRMPELSTEKFEEFKTDVRAYRTGDIGVLMQDGCLVVMGRKDFQVKIGGNGVNMADIESTLLMNFPLSDAIVHAFRDGMGEQRLTAYLVPKHKSKPMVNDIRSMLEALLPNYMIPTSYMFLARLPLSRDGKIDRNSLPKPDNVRSFLSTLYVAPETSMEFMISEIWAEALEIEVVNIGVQDSFFELGGDSIRATVISNRLARRLRVDINFGVILRYPTIRSLVEYLVDFQRIKML